MSILIWRRGFTITIGNRQLCWFRPSYCTGWSWWFRRFSMGGRVTYRFLGFDTYGWNR